MVTVLYNQPLNRKKLEADLEAAKLNVENVELEKRKKTLEIQKLEREERLAVLEESKLLIESGFGEELAIRGASEFVRRVENRLLKSPIKIRRAEVRVVDPIDDLKMKEGLHRFLEGEDIE